MIASFFPRTLNPRGPGVSDPGWGSPSEKFMNPTENCCRPAQLREKHSLGILEGWLITNYILSALHLQGLKSKIYICVCALSISI
jgi:hypothetical protein